MTPYTVRVVAPQDHDWGAFRCGDERIDRKVRQQVRRAGLGLVRLHGLYVGAELQGVLTLQAGILQAPQEVIRGFGVSSDVPTLQVEVLAVQKSAQGRGYGRALTEHALKVALTISETVGLKTLSLEATAQSAPFYAALGFDQATAPWPDGSLPMWLVLD